MMINQEITNEVKDELTSLRSHLKLDSRKMNDSLFYANEALAFQLPFHSPHGSHCGPMVPPALVHASGQSLSANGIWCRFFPPPFSFPVVMMAFISLLEL